LDKEEERIAPRVLGRNVTAMRKRAKEGGGSGGNFASASSNNANEKIRRH
jgi:hypothetical protein